MCYLKRRAVYTIKVILCAAASISLNILLLLTPPALLAQSQNARDTARADLETRQRALRNLEKVKARLSKRPPEPRPIVRQNTEEDFEQLQLVNYHLSSAVAANGPALDYEQIRKDAAEVKKRASHLKTSLLLPEPAKDEKPEKNKEELTSDEELKPAINALDALVNSFAWNPIFQHPNVLDMEQSVKARRDLEGIIRLSERIQKRAEALGKAAGKNH